MLVISLKDALIGDLYFNDEWKLNGQIMSVSYPNAVGVITFEVKDLSTGIVSEWSGTGKNRYFHVLRLVDNYVTIV